MKTKMFGLYGIAVALASVFLVSGSVMAAQIISKVEDASVALRVKNGYDTTLTIVVTGAGTNLTVACDAHTNTVNGDVAACDIISELDAAILACTNAAGTASLTINAEPSLAADSTDGELLDGTYTAAEGKWLELLWDTSAHLSLDLYFPSRTYQTGVSAYILDKVQALPTGTGDVTASVYKNGTLIASKVITSPSYVLPETLLTGGTNINTNTLGTVATVNLDWEVDMPFTGKDAVIIRAARATTLTAGVISATIPNQ